MDSMNQLTYWYFGIGVVWSAFQGVRGVVETRLANPGASSWKPWERVVVLYIHDFAFRFVCTLAGFVSLYTAIMLFNSLVPEEELSTGDVALLFVSFLVGVIGIGGQLHYVILLGRWPSTKGH
jgi:hypothetical protein